jgi:purine-binding chemotaxis protein CheW
MAFSELPAAREDVLGLITIRDEVMPLIDLRRCFRQPDVQLRLDTPVIAIREQDGPIALVFDDADRVVEIDPTQIKKSDHQQYPYIRAVAQDSGRLLLLLDTRQISEQIKPERITAQAGSMAFGGA